MKIEDLCEQKRQGGPLVVTCFRIGIGGLFNNNRG
jgi:hypothetical protein